MTHSFATPPRSSFSVYGSKAVETTVLEDGDLIIEGLLAVWDGDDREGENFLPGAFSRGIKSFLSGQSALAYHHQHDSILGRVLDLRETPDGVAIRARVDGAIKNDPKLGTIYRQIRNGTLRGLSVGGFFKRLGNRITNVDITECSITAVPVHPGTHFAVVEGKAMKLQPTWDDRLALAELRGSVREIQDLRRSIDRARVDAFMRS